MKHHGLIASLIAGVTSLAGVVQAQGAPPPGAPPPGPPPPMAPPPPPAEGSGGARTHDGFFLRLGLNLGPGMVTEEFSQGPLSGEFKYSGIATGFDLYLGGTLAPGFVLGGALIATWSSNPSVETPTGDVDLDGTLIFAGTALFANYYIDPGEGLHFQGLLGFGALDFVTDEGQSGGNDPTGVFFGGGVGYEFWVADEWSIGPFGRVIYGSLSTDATDVSYLYPSIGVGFTLH
jgi:hypothetical protein